MSKIDLYTVTMRRDIPIKTLTGERVEEVVETFKDMTWEESLTLRKRFTHVADITVHKTASGAGRKKAATTGRDYSVEVGGQRTRERQAEPIPTKSKKARRESLFTAPAHDLAGLVSAMAEKEDA